MVMGGCGHSICLDCIERIKELPPPEQTCPTCRERVDLGASRPNHALRDAIASVTGPPVAPQAPPSSHEACPTHGDRIRFLCATHSVLCCATCFLEDHDDCDRHPLEAARQQLERRIISALNDMRESGERLQSAQLALSERAATVQGRREAVKTEVQNFFNEFAVELERRRETLLSQADAYFDSVDSTLKSRLTYLTNGLMFLEGLFQEMSNLRRTSQVEFLVQGPHIALKMESAVVEAKQAIGPIEALGRPDASTPYFQPPSSASIAASLATIKVLDGTTPASAPAPSPTNLVLSPHLTFQQQQPQQYHHAAPSPVAVENRVVAPQPPSPPIAETRVVFPAPSPAIATAAKSPAPPAESPPQQPVATAAPAPAAGKSPGANGHHGGKPASPRQQQQQQQAKQQAPPGHISKIIENGNGAQPWGGKKKQHGGGGGKVDIHDDSAFPPLEVVNAKDDDWLVAGAEKKLKERREKKAAAQAAGKQQQPPNGADNKDKEGGGGNKGGGNKKAAALPAPVVPFTADKPHVCVMNNTTNNGMDGFLHLHPPDGSYYAIYYNFIGKVATTNKDGSDPKTYKKGDKFEVELKDNPFVALAEEKPERKYVAAAMRRAK